MPRGAERQRWWRLPARATNRCRLAERRSAAERSRQRVGLKVDRLLRSTPRSSRQMLRPSPRATAPFRPSALGKSHRHEPGVARHEHLCPTITSSAISQEIELSFFAACDLSPIMRLSSERHNRISAPRFPASPKSHSSLSLSSYTSPVKIYNQHVAMMFKASED